MIKVKIDIDFEKAFGEALKKSDAKSIQMKKMVTALQDATPIDTGEARAGWSIVGSTIQNDVEHINMLNEGSSKQAPSRFVERTLLAQAGVKANGIITRTL